MKVIVLSIFLLISFQICAGFSGINHVITTLSTYQTDSGFKYGRDDSPTLGATENALFLSYLFGQKDKIKSPEVLKFIQSLENYDRSYGNKKGATSDLESLRKALLSYAYLQQSDYNKNLGANIQAHYDKDNNLYSNTVGGSGNLKATSIAVQTIDSLGIHQQNKDALKSKLSSLQNRDEKSKTRYFSEETCENYYAIVVGQYVGYTFTDPNEWVNYFVSRQAKSGDQKGGFYSSDKDETVDVEEADCAINALYSLEKAQGAAEGSYVDLIDAASLYSHVQTLPRDLSIAALAYRALARTKYFQKLFDTTVTYEANPSRFAVVGNRIVQNSKVKPILVVRTNFDLAHAGLDVNAFITDSTGKKKTSIKLTWNSESQSYVGEEFYTAEKLGELSVNFEIKWLIVSLGSEIKFSISDKKTVGYAINIESKAKLAGKDIEPTKDIGIGTSFNFDVSLSTVGNPNLISGNFNVKFTVADSSNIVISESTKDCKDNKEKITFSTTLEKADIPSGRITFSFQVYETGSSVHTMESVYYVLLTKMVATNIEFNNEKKKL